MVLVTDIPPRAIESHKIEKAKQMVDLIRSTGFDKCLDKRYSNINICNKGKGIYIVVDGNKLPTVTIKLEESKKILNESGGLFRVKTPEARKDLPYSVLEADRFLKDANGKMPNDAVYFNHGSAAPMFISLMLLICYLNDGVVFDFVEFLMVYVLLYFKKIPDNKLNLFEDYDPNIFLCKLPPDLYSSRFKEFVIENDKIAYKIRQNSLYEIIDLYEMNGLDPKTTYPNVVSLAQIIDRLFNVFGSILRDVLNPEVCARNGVKVYYDLVRDVAKDKIDLFINDVPTASAINTMNGKGFRDQKEKYREAKIDFSKYVKILTVFPKDKYKIYIWDEKDIDIIKDALNDNWSGEKLVYVGDVL